MCHFAAVLRVRQTLLEPLQGPGATPGPRRPNERATRPAGAAEMRATSRAAPGPSLARSGPTRTKQAADKGSRRTGTLLESPRHPDVGAALGADDTAGLLDGPPQRPLEIPESMLCKPGVIAERRKHPRPLVG